MRKDKRIIVPYLRTEKNMKYEGQGNINCGWCAGNCLQEPELELGKRIETIQTTELPRSAKIPRRILKTQGDLLSLKFL